MQQPRAASRPFTRAGDEKRQGRQGTLRKERTLLREARAITTRDGPKKNITLLNFTSQIFFYYYDVLPRIFRGDKGLGVDFSRSFSNNRGQASCPLSWPRPIIVAILTLVGPQRGELARCNG